MSSIDERIVQMRFDNRQFESGVQTTIKSLGDLKKGLNLEASTKSLENLDRAGRSFSLEGIANGIESLNSKFSALGAIGVTALMNITNSALNAGKRITAALTIDPIKTGFEEYETKINAIQTILTNTKSKGTTIDDVNKALGELNTYADKTIYNFSEMTKNIGTFTAAGVDLDSSVSAIKGIANLAAGSGSTAEQASTAMYQLSQALASGSVKLQDWNSVVNAGMGGELFQNALKDTAKQMGVVVKAGEPFRETLKSGWLTADILTKTLEKFANDEDLVKAATQVKTFTQLFDTMKESVQSGWAVSWEHIIGNKDEAAASLTKLSDAFNNIVGPSADARNATLKFWHDNGGRSALIDGITNAFKGLRSILTPISEAFNDIFPATTGQRLVDITNKFKEITSKFKIGDDTLKNLKNTFKGVFSLFDIGQMFFIKMAEVAGALASSMLPVVDGFLSITGAIGEFITAIRDSLKNSESFTNAIDSIKKVLAPSADGIGVLLKSLGDSLSNLASVDTGGVEKLGSKLKIAFSPLVSIFEVFTKAFENIAPLLMNAAKTIVGVLTKFVDQIASAISKMDFQTLITLLNGALMAGILKGIKDFIKQFSDLTGSGKSVVENFSGILDGVRGSLESFLKNIQAKTLMTIATSVAILAGSLIALSLIDSDKLETSLETLSVLFAEMFISSGIFGKLLGGARLVGAIKSIMTIQGLAIAILILAKALDEISGLNWGQVAKGITTISALSAILSLSAKTIGKNVAGLSSAAFGLIGFSIAINILAKAVSELGKLNIKTLAKGLGSIAVLITELVLFMKFANFDKTGPVKSLFLIELAIALNIFAAAVGSFGGMDVAKIVKGLVAMGGVLTEVAIFTKLTGNVKNVTTTAIGLTILGGAMIIFGKAISVMGSLPLATIAKGLGAMAGALLEITIAMNFMPPNMIVSAFGMTVLATALFGLSLVLKSLGEMSVTEIAKSLFALGGSLAILAGGMQLMAGGLPGTLVMLAMSVALALFTPQLILLSSVPFMGIVAGLAALAGIFIVIGLAGLVLAPLTPAILALGGAIALLGIGFLAVGGGVMLFATGIALLATNLTAFISVLAQAVKDTVKIIPDLFRLIGEALKALAKVIGDAAPDIVKALVVLLDSLIEAVAISVPKIVDLFIKLMLDIVTKLEEALPKLVESGGNMIISLLKGLSEKIPAIVTAAAELVVKFIEGLNDNLSMLIDAGFEFIISFINGISDALDSRSTEFGTAIGRLAGAIITGLINGIKAGFKELFKTGAELGKSALTGAAEFLGIHSPSREFAALGVFSGKGYINGLKSTQPELVKTTKSVFQNGVLAPTKETLSNLSATMSKGGAALKEFTSKYAKMSSKFKDAAPIISATDAIDAYSKQLYVETEQYKTDTEALKEHKKELVDLTAEYAKLEKDLKNTTTKDKAKEVQSQLETVGKSITETKTQIIQDEQDIVDHTKQTFDDLKKSISDSVKDSIDPLKSSLETNVDLFKAFDAGSEIAIKDILTNMKSQVEGVKQWNADLESLADKGFAKGLLSQLKNMGPSGSNYVQAFMKMTTDQMNTANTEFQETSKMTAEALITNFDDSLTAAKKWAEEMTTLSKTGLKQGIIEALGKMGMDSAEYVESFMEMSPEQIKEFNEKYEEYLSLPDSVSNSIMQSFMNAGSSAVIKFVEAVKATTDPESEDSKILAENSTNIGSDTMTNVVAGMNSEEETLKVASQTLGKVIYDGLNVYLSNAKGEQLGGYMCDGLVDGLENNSNAVKKAARRVARDAYEAAKEALDINSPSKEFEELGMYADKGLIVGFKKLAGLVSAEASSVGTKAVSSLKLSVSKVADILSMDLDNIPVIKPVLDLTNIKTGSLELNSLLDSNRNLSIGSVVDKTSSVSNGMSRDSSYENQNGKATPTGSTFQFEQNIYSPKALSRIEIYRQTKNQFSIVKGLVDNT